MLNKKIKAFTMAELLVTLALTAILITLSYSGLNYIQKLLQYYNTQSFFITQLTELDKRINYQSVLARQIYSEKENDITFVADSTRVDILFDPTCIVIKKENQADSFLLDNSGLKLTYEHLDNPTVSLISSFEFDVDFRKQKFHCIFRKNYDGYSKFILETKDGNH